MGENNDVQLLKLIADNMSDEDLGEILRVIIGDMCTDMGMQQTGMDEVARMVHESEAGFNHWKSQQ